MLLIYTHKITPRFTYIMKHLFGKILGIEVTLTTKVEDFIKHSGAKITYSKQPLQNEFFIRNNDLLYQQGISDLEINISDWDGTPCFFATGERSNIPFDVFAASFYLISRYEEYLPHVKDAHGRYPVKESLAYKHKFLEKPVVDIWMYKLLAALLEQFPDLEHKRQTYKYTSVIDVTTSHCYAHRGLLRSAGGLLLDLVTLKFKRVFQRVSVWFNPKKDPYNNFDHLISLHKKNNVKSMFFFQFADYSTFDKNVSTSNNKFRYLIKSVADYSVVSLAASYNSFSNIEILKEEKRKLGAVVNRPIKYVRFRYNRVEIPTTYKELVDAEFSEDFTMGYTHCIGFRAGTCSPFSFYDIHLESQQPIKIHPFAVHNYALGSLKNEKQISIKLDSVYQELKKVNGKLITIFSNELLGKKQRINWMRVYENVIKKYNV
ncbi:MAG: polysaccharide deacetylase family protein [Cellulophaga sp.]